MNTLSARSALLQGIDKGNLTEQLRSVHQEIKIWHPAIDRMAIALYDVTTGLLRTFASSNSESDPLEHYEVPLRQVPSLAKLALTSEVRVVGDIDKIFTGNSQHTLWLKRHRYRSSLTVPIHEVEGGKLSAFFFFNSKQVNAFGRRLNAFLRTLARLLCRLYLHQIRQARGMQSMVRMVSGLARVRDLETGQHLERMAHYARLIAQAVADERGLTDEFIEYLFLFAPLHDIGKAGIPDSILGKPGKLDAQEWEIMRTHVDKGVELIDKIGEDLSHGNNLAFSVMRNVVACHHERADGSGYPQGLRMHEIPIEGHITAIADVYDALSNRRSYKAAWTEEQVVAEMRSEVLKGRLDGTCVEALLSAKPQRLDIQARFADDEVQPPVPSATGPFDLL